MNGVSEGHLRQPCFTGPRLMIRLEDLVLHPEHRPIDMDWVNKLYLEWGDRIDTYTHPIGVVPIDIERVPSEAGANQIPQEVLKKALQPLGQELIARSTAPKVVHHPWTAPGSCSKGVDSS
jgi:hypothetical protein